MPHDCYHFFPAIKAPQIARTYDIIRLFQTFCMATANGSSVSTTCIGAQEVEDDHERMDMGKSSWASEDRRRLCISFWLYGVRETHDCDD
jgi:hypothetical protein